MRQWDAGEGQPRPGVWQDLRRLVHERRDQLGELAKELDRLP